MIAPQAPFSAVSRALHWLMAAMVLAMLFIGIGMAASVSERYRLLVSIHRPLGVAILILVAVRFANRLLNPPPPLPADMTSLERFGAKASHVLLYALMFLMPLVGWGMLSAASYPIVLYGSLQLPPILPHNLALYAALRHLHTYLAYLLFATFLAHFGAALFHGLIRQDGVLSSMAAWRTHPTSFEPTVREKGRI
jgi:cytochrome b561